MKDMRFRGVGVALVTPFTAESEVDYAALERMVEHVTEGGADYIVALGSTAEAATLRANEREEVLRFIIDRNAGRLPIVAGVGGNFTQGVTEQLGTMNLDGVDAILSVTPFYNKPSQEGLYRHFSAIAQASPRPVILYNVPGRTGINMTAQTTLRIARDNSNVIGIKEASGDIEQMQRIIDGRSDDFLVISGDDALTVELMRRGGDGVISVAANAFPRRFTDCIAKAAQGLFDEADKAFAPLAQACEALFAEGNPTGVKCMLSVMGLAGDKVRLPLTEGSESLRERFAKLVAEYELR
ncbi:MAG: 4-hydroxy-tetrahydrodipicolinate synthase [Alistipes sp.]|nr:4-hydroxy-tetrahydrodipicolinate synthase [Alistipes sp.]MDE7129138.1 4-hydroxy-tetrahydrodipicolinate synthase [Alistipes sp.]